MKKQITLIAVVMSFLSMSFKYVAPMAGILYATKSQGQSLTKAEADTLYKHVDYVPLLGYPGGYSVTIDGQNPYELPPVDWSWIQSKPNFASVCFSANYNDLIFIPDLNNLPNYYHKYESDTLHKLAIGSGSISLKTGTLVVNSVALPVQITQTLTGTNGVTVTTGSNTFTITQKRQETYTGTTNASGVVTFTFSAFPAVPNIQYTGGFGSGNKETIIPNAAYTTTSCSFYCQLRSDVVGLLPTYSNVSGREINIIVTEK